VTGLGWHLKAPKDATESEIARTSELADMLRTIPNFEDAQYDLTDAIGKGLAALEIDWRAGEQWVPRELTWVPQRMFQVENTGGQLQYLKNGIPEPLREYGWIVHEHRAKSGYIESAALFRVLAWTYAYKAYNVRDMQRFLEVYGLPLRLGKYPSGLGEKERDALLRAVRNIGNDGAGVVPDTMNIEFVQAQKSGTVTDFLSAIEYWEKKQSIAILGGTLTSQADGKTSTNALGEVHDHVRREIMLHDVYQIEPTVNRQLLRPIALINGLFPEDRLPTFTYLTEETVDQEKMVQVLKEAVGIGMEIDLDWAHGAMQIPRAAEGAEILRQNAGASHGLFSWDMDSADLRRRTAALARTSERHLTDAYAAQMASLCAPFEQKIIDQIAAIVAESGGFDEALEKIEALKRDEAGYQEWSRSIAEGMAAANLAGRA
jgi:phage gp29-like protein